MYFCLNLLRYELWCLPHCKPYPLSSIYDLLLILALNILVSYFRLWCAVVLFLNVFDVRMVRK